MYSWLLFFQNDIDVLKKLHTALRNPLYVLFEFIKEIKLNIRLYEGKYRVCVCKQSLSVGESVLYVSGLLI